VSELILDDLELELRKLPGVRAAGFDTRDDLLIVQLHVVPGAGDEGSLPIAATRIAARHADRPVAVEVVRWRDAPSSPLSRPDAPAAPVATEEPGAAATDAAADESTGRMRLLAVLSFPDTDELEVHLILDGRRTIGRAPASRGLVAALDATLAAVKDFGFSVDPTPQWARALESTAEEALVAVALEEAAGGGVLYGVASGATPIDAAARATLDAINRKTTRA
jgi:hypothetical protein